MTLHERAATLSQDNIVELIENATRDKARIDVLQQQLDWFKRELFGPRSERRIVADGVRQLSLGETLVGGSSPSVATTTVKSHERRRRPDPLEDSVNETGLRFDDSVPVEEIEVPNPEMASLPADAYDIVGEKQTHRLAQRPGAYVILRYKRKVIKRKDSGEFACPPAPASVLEKSYADVSFLAGLLIDKLAYHLPLYRQHQRLKAAGIELGRSTLTTFVHRTAELLEPVYRAQMESILGSKVLAMDETPIKAGRKRRGKMQTGYFWPVYGDQDEIVFPYSSSRAAKTVQEVLSAYCGVLVSDGYAAYAHFAEKVNDVVHAQCWAHTRRKFVQAEAVEPVLVDQALTLIASLYEQEAELGRQQRDSEKRLAFRREHCRPIVDEFFTWLKATMADRLLLPQNPFTKAAGYALPREKGLRVFLDYPDVPVDTNHLEREIRPIALGRKNWLFCWTELGAQHVGVVQSLLATCRLQGVDPYTYLVDVLQRIDSHPAKDVAQLTPRCWKEHFAAAPLRSDVYRIQNDQVWQLSRAP